MQNKRLLIIGGGIAGMSSALEAAGNGIEVYLVEKTASIGGWANSYCCKATEKCNKCAVCLVPQAKMQVEKNPLITIFDSSEVIEISGQPGSYETKLITDQGEIELEVAAIILAIGFKPFDATEKGEFHYGKHPNVITALELEQILNQKGSVIRSFGDIKNIGFIQCVGSRDLTLGNNYCSKVCCMYASKLAKLIRSELPDIEISIFYMDFQTFGKGYDEFIKSCKEDDKIKFIRGIPAKIFSFPYDYLTVRYADSITGEAIEDKFDLVVLSTAMTPCQDIQKLAEIMKIETNEHGFFATSLINPVITNQKAVFVAGTCQSPKDIQQSIQQGKAAVSAAINYLTKV